MRVKIKIGKETYLAEIDEKQTEELEIEIRLSQTLKKVEEEVEYID